MTRKRFLKKKFSTTTLVKVALFMAVPLVLGIGWMLVESLDFRPRASLNDSYDVVVVGAGTGGIGAAIQAARMGASVAILEETDMVGGQMIAAGVTSIDLANEQYGTGVYAEFRDKITAYYAAKGMSVSTCYWSNQKVCFEPKVGHQILLQMLRSQPNISLKLLTKVVNVTKEGDRVTGVVTSQGALKSKVVVEATEYGDLLPLAGATYRIGNQMSGTPLASCVQDITYLGVMKKYPQGVPAELTFTAPPPGYTARTAADFKKIVDPASDRPTYGQVYPVNMPVHNAYRGMPDSTNPVPYRLNQPSDYAKVTKTGINWANDYPAQVLHTDNGGKVLSSRYIEDKDYRDQENCNAKLKTLQFMYYVQHDLGMSDWAIANDEGYDTPYNREENSCAAIPQSLKAMERQLPVIPYVREARRAVGVSTVSAKQLKREGTPARGVTAYPSSIAVGDYSFDLHNCSELKDLELSLETPDDWIKKPGPFQVPFEVLIPEKIDGLVLAEKNISVSRLVNGAIRLQPITMQIGQAAGAIAAQAARKNIQPRAVDVRLVQKVLVDSKSMLTAFTDVGMNHPSFGAVQLVALRGIMGGYGNLTFGVDNLLTRAQAALVLTRAFSIPLVEVSSPSFEDVGLTANYLRAVETLYARKITSGCSANPRLFCPGKNITNAEIGILIHRSMALTDSTIVPVTPDVPTYTDLPKTHPAYAYVEGLAAKGVFMYCDQSARTFCPTKEITRGEFARWIVGGTDRSLVPEFFERN